MNHEPCGETPMRKTEALTTWENSCGEAKNDAQHTYVPSSKHGIWAMVIHPILGIITMGILNPIDGCMTIPFYEKTNHVFDHGTYESKPVKSSRLVMANQPDSPQKMEQIRWWTVR